MNQEKKVNTEVMESQKAHQVIKGLISKAKDLKLIEQEAKTGFSYFQGKKRLCKLLKTKRGVTLEINVKLPKKLSDEHPELQNISPALAHKKHLGTMKHLYRSSKADDVTKIMTEALKVFKADIKSQEQEDQVKEA